jgi:hypothetical protein
MIKLMMETFPSHVNHIINAILVKNHLRAFIISGGQRWGGFVQAHGKANENRNFRRNWRKLPWNEKQSFRWQVLWSVVETVVDLTSRKINVINAEHNTSPLVFIFLLRNFYFYN